jgi:hypothetical protein
LDPESLRPQLSRSARDSLAPGCGGKSSGVDYDQFASRGRRWYWLPTLFEILNVKLDRFTNEVQDVIASVRGGYAARKIWDIRAE